MLVTQFAKAFGADSPLTVPSVDPQVFSIGQTVSDADVTLKQAFNKIQLLALSAPGQTLNPKLIQAYSDARTAVLSAGQVWIDSFNNATPAERGTTAQMEFPPEFSFVAKSSNGFGASLSNQFPNRPIRASEVVVTFGPQGNQRTVPLGEAPMFGVPSNQLGEVGLIIFGIVMAVAIIFAAAAAIAFSIAKKQEAVTAGIQAQEKSRLVSQSLDVAAQCVNKSTTDDARADCIKNAQDASVAILNAFDSPKSGSSTAAVLGTLMLLAAIGVGGYVYYRRTHRGAGEAI